MDIELRNILEKVRSHQINPDEAQWLIVKLFNGIYKKKSNNVNFKPIQLTLFNEKDIFIKQRPNYVTNSQMEKFYEKTAKQIIENNWPKEECPLKYIIEDLKRIDLEESGNEMFQTLNSYLANCNYVKDTNFIDFLEDLSLELANIKKQNEISWIQAFNIKPKYKKGDKIKLPLSTSIKLYLNSNVVFVQGVEQSTGKYKIELTSNSSIYRLIDFELIENDSILIK